MVYVEAAKKTAGYMVLAMVLSLSIVTLLSGDLDTAATGRTTSIGTPGTDSGNWVVFLLGAFVGALVVGTYFYVTKLEAKRQE